MRGWCATSKASRGSSRLVEMLNLIEATGVWPEAVALGLIGLIPKGAGAADPLKHRPITIMSLVYCLWSGTRMQHSRGWQSFGAHPGLTGGIAGRGAANTHVPFSMEVEEAFAGGTFLAGLSFDVLAKLSVSTKLTPCSFAASSRSWGWIRA